MLSKETKIIDVDRRIRVYMHRIVNDVEKKGLSIDWDKLQTFCKSFGSEPNLLCVPVCVIDRCLSQVKKERGDNAKN